MPYNLRPRAPTPGHQPAPQYQLTRKSGNAKHDFQVPKQSTFPPKGTATLLHNRVVIKEKSPGIGGRETLLNLPANTTDSESGSPVLVAASPTCPLTELPDEFCQFLDPIEIGRGRSGIVYRVQISTDGHSHFAAVKMMDDRDEFEQEIKAYDRLTSQGFHGLIPDIYGYRRWTRARWKDEFPSLYSSDKPAAGAIFMEYLGPDLKLSYDGRDIDPTYIAEYLDIMWMLRKTHVYHKDIDLNLFVCEPRKTLVLLDFAYSTLSLTSSALEMEWKNSALGILRDCVCIRARFC